MCGRNAGWTDVNRSISYVPWNEFLWCGRPLLLLDVSLLGPFWLDVVLLDLMEQVEHGVGSRRRCRRLFDMLDRTRERITLFCWHRFGAVGDRREDKTKVFLYVNSQIIHVGISYSFGGNHLLPLKIPS